MRGTNGWICLSALLSALTCRALRCLGLCTAGMGERACICCDRLVLMRDLSATKKMTAALCSHVVEKLTVPTTWAIHPSLQRLAAEYNVVQYFPEFPELTKVLLSPRGVAAVPRRAVGEAPVEEYGDSAARLHLCEECDVALLKREATCRPPKYAVRNGLAIGRGFLRELRRALQRGPSLAENKMTALNLIDAYFVSVRGGPSQALKTHVMSFGDAPPSAPAASLPRELDATQVHIIFAAPFTQAQIVATQRRFLADVTYMRRMLEGYKADNHLYHELRIADERLTVAANDAATDRISTRLIAGMGAVALSGLDTIVDSVRDPLPVARAVLSEAEVDAAETADQAEATMVTQRVGVVNVGGDHTQRHAILQRFADAVFADPPVVGAPVAGLGTPAFVSRRSTAIVTRSTPFRVEMAFPHLFPYGRGGFSDFDRDVHIGREALYRYYLQHSTRLFSQDDRFCLAAFDELAMSRVMSNVFVYFTCRPDAAATVGSMTGDQLTTAIRLHVEEGETLRRGEAAEQVPSDVPGGREFVRGLQAGTSKMWNSNDETKQYRKEILALRQQEGRAHLFITFSRANKDMVTVSVYAGAGERSVEAAYEAAAGGLSEDDLVRQGFLVRDNCIWRQRPLENVIPSELLEPSAALKKRVGNDPAAAARYYDRLIHLFIEHVLGWNMKLRRSSRAGGLFGHTKALYGGTETQGQVSARARARGRGGGGHP